MQVVSHDVTCLLSQIRVISSERRYPSLGDISNRAHQRCLRSARLDGCSSWAAKFVEQSRCGECPTTWS